MKGLDNKELERYARHIIMKDIGVKGQKKLLESSVFILGAGGLGSAISMYLTAAGVGTIGIADGDVVEESNLQRQIIHDSVSLGMPKVESAEKRLRALNPYVNITTYNEYLHKEDISSAIADYDFVIDAVDDYRVKYMINDACVEAGKPFCHAGVVGFTGQLMTVVPGETPCLRCIFGEEPEEGSVPTCKQIGVLGAMVGVIGSLEALEAIKYITGAGELLTGKMLTVDGLGMNIRKVTLPPRGEGCDMCR